MCHTIAAGRLQRVIEIARLDGVDYLLVGGYAVNIQGYVRTTNDLDIG